jgi:hypothetical protein
MKQPLVNSALISKRKVMSRRKWKLSKELSPYEDLPGLGKEIFTG